MNVKTTKINGVVIAESAKRQDSRGSFSRLFCDQELSEVLGQRKIVQINHSHTVKKGSVRGLHFQYPPFAEMKFVRCLRGRVFDVAVDLRKNSPTYLQWHGEELSAENWHMLVVPEGCAHGFQTLSDDCELLYLHTAPYAPEKESGVRFDDPRINIQWPLQVAEVSDRDKKHALIDQNFHGIEL